MGKGSGKRATRKRVADVSAAAHEDAEQLKRATRRRLAKLEKDLAAVRRVRTNVDGGADRAADEPRLVSRCPVPSRAGSSHESGADAG